MKYILYGNGTAGNHGCEAIVRGTQTVLSGEPIMVSHKTAEDIKYHLNHIAEVVPSTSRKRNFIEYLFAYIHLKRTGDYVPMDGVAYLDTIRQLRGKANLAISIGGDNYCYGDTGIYEYLNKAYHQYGFKTALWGCSVEPEVVEKVKDDLNRYNLIVARESITFEAMKKVCDHVVLAPDPAFFMESEECELPIQFEKPIIGINASPMILSYEKNQGMTYQNYCNLISYILKETEYNIALIPHVVWDTNDDRKVLQKLYDKCGCPERVVFVEDHSAPQLKYIISKCEMFIGARTHATIAAYSTTVPTLVVGYSVKARGIARDLFGTEEKYVIPVQSLNEPLQLIAGFRWLDEHKVGIRSRLYDYLPTYQATMNAAVEQIRGLLE